MIPPSTTTGPFLRGANFNCEGREKKSFSLTVSLCFFYLIYGGFEGGLMNIVILRRSRKSPMSYCDSEHRRN